MKIKIIKNTQFDFYEMEQLRETVKGSDFEHLQLSNGQFVGHNKQLMLTNSIISTGRYNQKILVQGTFPKELLTFGMILNEAEAGILSGQSLKRGDLVFFPENSELHYLIPKNTTWITFNIPRQLLEQNGFEFSLNKARIIRPLSLEFLSLTSLMEHLYSDESNINAEETEKSIINCIHNTMMEDALGGQKQKRLQLAKKTSVLKNIHSYLNDNPMSTIKVSELINEFNYSHRTINYLFMDAFNMTLKQYIKTTKLNQLRSLLQMPLNKDKTITEMAESCGLAHMGRVAQEYHVLFAENPSETRCRKDK